MAVCSTCGVELDDIPFEPCAEHTRHHAAQPTLTEEELEELLFEEAARALYERTGDD